MPGTFTKLLYHIVFSTKNRVGFITPDLQPRLHEYLGGIVRSERGIAMAVGGMTDHVHLLIRWRTDGAISNLLRDLKCNSSRWIHDTFPQHRSFEWQEGYGAFTVSHSQAPVVVSYIENQQEHHRARTFDEEIAAILKAHEVEFEEKYLLG